MPNGLPPLRDASVAWTLEAFYYLRKNPQLVRKAWEKCQTGAWNFTWEKLTSPEAKDLFYTTLAQNEAFRNELGVPGPHVPRSRRGKVSTTVNEPIDEDGMEFGSAEDDPSISINELVGVLTGETSNPDIRTTEEGELSRFGDEADITPIAPDELHQRGGDSGLSKSSSDIESVHGNNTSAAGTAVHNAAFEVHAWTDIEDGNTTDDLDGMRQLVIHNPLENATASTSSSPGVVEGTLVATVTAPGLSEAHDPSGSVALAVDRDLHEPMAVNTSMENTELCKCYKSCTL